MAGYLRNRIPFTLSVSALARVLAVLCVVIGAVPVAGATSSDTKYPSHPIRIMVPAAPGGSLGNEIRAITPFLEKSLGMSTVIDYVAGADGMIAYNKFPHEKPDGYTLLYFNLIAAIPLELTRETAKYSVKNYTPIGGWNVKYQALLVHPDTWKTFAEFLGDAKKRPVSLAGTGGHTVLNVHVIESALGIKFNLVPFKSSGEGIAAVAGKHVECMLTYETTPKPMIQAGKLRALAVLSSKPDPILPGVPNLKELGHEEVSIIPAYGVFAAPPNTPRDIVAMLERALGRTAVNTEFLKLADTMGTYVDFLPSTALRTVTAEQYNLVNRYKQFMK